MINLYEHLLLKTQGALDRHCLNRFLLQIEPGTKLYFSGELQGALVKEGIEEANEYQMLLNGTMQHFGLKADIYFSPEQLIGNSDIEFRATKFFAKGKEYYISDETGLFLQPTLIEIHDLWLNFSTEKLSVGEKRRLKVEQFFDRYRAEHEMAEHSMEEIYMKIGMPSQEALWNEWQRLWPDIFNANYQKEFFRTEPLRQINYTLGTGKDRLVKIKLKK